MEKPAAVVLEVKVAWGEMDAFGHVNNTVYMRWFESARIAYFERLGVATSQVESGELGWPILARATVDYRAPVTYPDTISLEARVTKLGNTSFTMGYRAVSQAQKKLVAEGEAVVVMVDPSTGGKVRLNARLRDLVTQLEGLPPA